MALEEECKEALLSWRFASRAGARGLSEAELDDAVERYLRETYALGADFEVEDGLRKLRELGLVRESERGRLVAPDARESARGLALLAESRWRKTAGS
jgi:hypothetical protein